MTKTETYPIDDTAQLLKDACQDPLAFARLYDRFSTAVFRYLYSRVGNRSDAEDLTAQTFMTAMEKLPSYREQGYFKAWLFTIARNAAIDHFRKNQREVQLEAVDIPAEKSDLLTQVIQMEKVEQLAILIQNLDEHEQELLRLRYVGNLSFAEMSAILGKRRDAIKKSLYRLQDRLQSQMEVKNV